MREVQIRSWCDLCIEENEDERVEATETFTAGIVTGETRPELKLVELCEQHAKVLTDLGRWLADIGQPPALPAPARAKPKASTSAPSHEPVGPQSTCPVCDYTSSRSHAATHFHNAHLRIPKPAQPKACPTKGCDFAHDSAPQMGVHRASAHGWSALDEAYEHWKKFPKDRT